MRNSAIVTLVFLLSTAPHLRAGDQPPLEGAWTGGFWLDGNWVAVNLRFARPGEASGPTADVLFPTYGGRENAIYYLASTELLVVGAGQRRVGCADHHRRRPR